MWTFWNGRACSQVASGRPLAERREPRGVCGCPSSPVLAPDCKAQDERFSLVFTLASFMNNFMTFPTGYIFDRFHTTAARLLAM